VKTASTQAGLQTASYREVGAGGLLNPGAGETWVQLQFNFKRKFNGFTGILNGVWTSNANAAYPYRSIATPILYEYKITKDKDLLNLQADGLSVLRVSSSGDIYTAPNGSINTSGADLAERYMSQEPLENGTVVSIDPYNNHGVKKTQYQYQRDVIGVVSTDPGFVTGAYTEHSYPIALIGRVPVKVSTENGMIHTGDFITSASLHGYAMKASLSGRVIGKALESMDSEKLEECPAEEGYAMNRKCTTIMMFVNLIDYGGQSVDQAFSDWQMKTTDEQSAQAFALGLDVVFGGISSSTESISVDGMSLYQTRDGEILNFLSALKAERTQGITSLSEIFTDKVSAVSQIISPEMIAKVVTAQEVRGLEIISEKVTTGSLVTNVISGRDGGNMTFGFANGKVVLYGERIVPASTSTTLWNQMGSVFASLLDTTTDTSSTTALIGDVGSSTPDVYVENATTTEQAIVVSFDELGNASFAGEVVAAKVTAGALSVTGGVNITGGLEVSLLGSTTTTMSILSDTIFFGTPYFTSDTGGTAIVSKGAKEVDIEFGRDYIEAPIVTATMSYGTTTDDATVDAMFADDIRFAVTKRSVHGFTIRINKRASADVVFNWVALAIKDSKEFTSRTIEPDVVPAPDVIPNPDPTPTPEPIIDPTPTPDVDNSGGGDIPPIDTPPVVDPGVTSEDPISVPIADPVPILSPDPDQIQDPTTVPLLPSDPVPLQ
jgi:hypothetical protein